MFLRIGIRKTPNTDDSLGSGTKLLLLSLSLGFRHEERETQFFYADCSSIVTDPINVHAHSAVHKLHWPHPGPKINSLRLSPNIISLLLFRITKNPSPSFPGMTSFTSPSPISYLGFLLWHLWLSHPPRARVNTYVNVCTYPCTKPKGSKLTKPKDKIYKTQNENIKKNPSAIIQHL